MESLRRILTFGVLSSLLLWPLPLYPQLGPGSAVPLGLGGNYTASARGLSAMSYNPAGLGMPGTPGFSIAFFPVYGRQSLDPITLSDLADVEGGFLTASVKEDWLQKIADAGTETGEFGADLTLAALSVGPVGIQLSTLIRGHAALNEAGAELLLYGNAGRRGEPGDFDLENSGVSTLVVSSVGVSFGLPVRTAGESGAESTVAVGGTVKLSMGNALVYAQDLGSQVRSDPLEVALRFPMIVSDTSDIDVNHGTGIGLDLGLDWQRGPWTVGVAIQNLFHSFEWEVDGMYYRPGEALFNQDVSESDFDSYPASQAPAALQEEVTELKFKPQLAIGGAYEATPELTVTGDFRKRMGDGIEVGPDLHAGLGMEFRGIPFLPLRLGGAVITDGFQLGGGASLALGPVYLSWAGAIQGGDVEGAMASFSLTFGGF